MKLSVVMPVYNEERTLEEIVRRVQATPFDKEIILVNDCSKDGTAALLEKLAKEQSNVRVFHHAQNMGKGGALATGGWVAGNAWGLLYDLEDVGPSGRHLLALGEAAIPALLGLIDRTEVVLYEGSEEATIGNDRAYRVKDVAAYFVARLSGRPLGFHPDPAARDRAIEVLVAAVGAR